MNRILTLAPVLLLSACAPQTLHPSTNADHPANPEAALGAQPATAAAHNYAGHHHDEPGDTPAAPGAMYACPMHPEVTSNDPNAVCPKCGMKIDKKITPENAK
jgi:hypothetical protein